MVDFGTPKSVAGNPLVGNSLAQMLREALARNDVTGALRLYEQSGGVAAQALLQQFSVLGDVEKAALAQMLAQARDFANAARVYEQLARPADAAPLYDAAGEHILAARCYQAARNPLAAGAAFERAGRTDVALELYTQSQAWDAAAQLLVREQRFFDAAGIYRTMGNTRGEVDMLQRVPVHSPQRPPAVWRLAQLLEHFGHTEQAMHLLWETMLANPGARADPVFHQRLQQLADARGPEASRLARSFIQQAQSQPAPSTGKLSDSAEMRAVMDSHNIRHNENFARANAPELKSATVEEPDPFDALLGSSPDGNAYAHLKQIPLFGGLAMADMQALYRLCTHVAYSANSVVIEQDVTGGGLVVILEGTVNVMRVSNGVGTLLAVLGPGQYVGEISLLDAEPTSARVVATTPVRAVLLPRDAFNEFIATRDAAAARVLRSLALTLAARLRASNLRAEL